MDGEDLKKQWENSKGEQIYVSGKDVKRYEIQTNDEDKLISLKKKDIEEMEQGTLYEDLEEIDVWHQIDSDWSRIYFIQNIKIPNMGEYTALSRISKHEDINSTDRFFHPVANNWYAVKILISKKNKDAGYLKFIHKITKETTHWYLKLVEYPDFVDYVNKLEKEKDFSKIIDGLVLKNPIDTATINIKRCDMRKGFRPTEDAVFFQEEKYITGTDKLNLDNIKTVTKINQQTNMNSLFNKLIKNSHTNYNI